METMGVMRIKESEVDGEAEDVGSQGNGAGRTAGIKKKGGMEGGARRQKVED